ncbi:Protein of uncharacterised function (DUF2570) [Phocoenobacter uteri]|uniref:Protein of uncharacterized function (DUF2570) n=1 Tax=Phocoenobacter uteri TaxID=146806 RepID=A0A379CB74_9PAST|nr:DUF2570 family protein [Phocoenobacter uteri]MDG6880959.1 hypothetical protein [Phocoenobacter uteri]SUB58975.1 Protein of uncharacterised function (DUF2570) [Phocoenobacter uteri]
MFSRQITIKSVIAVLILGLCIWLWGQYQIILELRAENHAQSLLIKEQQESNQKLLNSLNEEREAVKKQQQAVIFLREKANDAQKNIKAMLKAEPCADTRLPDDAIKRLRSISRH